MNNSMCINLEKAKGKDYNGVWGNFGNDGHVHFHNYGDGFTNAYIHQN